MSYATKVVAGLIFLACVAGRVGAEPVPGEWSTMKADGGVTIYYTPAFAADAEKAKANLRQTVESLGAAFDGHDPKAIVGRINCRLYLHPQRNQHASEGHSNCIAQHNADGKVDAQLHVLTPSVMRPDSTNVTGEARNADHSFFRDIVHEYGSLWLGMIARDKPTGWMPNTETDAPNWFWQGYQEYVGMTCSSPHSRTVTFGKYMAIPKADPDRVMLARGFKDASPRIVVRNDYVDGFAVLAFMHERFGKRAVQGILTSQAPTFGRAMRDAVRMDPEEFYETYQRWLENWKLPGGGDRAAG